MRIFLQRFMVFLSNVQKWEQERGKLESVDLRYGREVILNPDMHVAPPQPPARSRQTGGGTTETGSREGNQDLASATEETEVDGQAKRKHHHGHRSGKRENRGSGGGNHRGRPALSRSRHRAFGWNEARRDRGPGAAGKSVSEAVVRAETSSGLALESAVVGISGPHIRSVNSHGVISLGSRPRELTSADVQAAGDKAREIPMPEDREILHLLQQEFVVDEQDGVRQPVGMLGRQLEVRVHVITAAHSAVQNVVTALNRAGMHVEDTVYEALACSESVLRRDERELGAAVIDIGAGTADIAVVQEDVVIHSGVVPLGGINFTRDVAYGLETPLVDAESLKRQFGCSMVTRIAEQNEIEVPSVGDRPPRMMRQRDLGEILQPRACELMELCAITCAMPGC